jgi:branched-subunit amino acid aminotransferase/4-amino-4-deoxychorismate lyase
MRESVLIHLKTQNQVCHQVNVPVQILMEAEAVMITNCLYGLLPVNSFKNLSGEISRYQMQPVKKLFAAISQTLR